MSGPSKIEWCDATWNPVRGCLRVSEGCRNCYAETIAARFSDPGQPYHGFAERDRAGSKWTGKVELIESTLNWPLTKKKPLSIFVNSMSDLFHENLSAHAIGQVFEVMAEAVWHTFLVLTKRPEEMRDCVSRIVQARQAKLPSNIWLGVSVEDQATADERIPLLLDTPAAKRFISAEPLLGPTDLTPWLGKLDWIICGGESGKGARPMHPDWARSLRDQCFRARVPFFFKQKGEFDDDGNRVGKKRAGRLLDCQEWNEMPR